MARFSIGAWLRWVAVFVVATVVLRSSREQVGEVHAVLVFLLIVLGASVSGGRPLGLTLTVAGFLVIDYFFQIPYDTFTVDIAKPLDWLVLVAFVTTAMVATELLALERGRAAEAERRAGEVASLSRVGAEILSAGRTEDTLAALADLMRTSLDVACCRIYARDPAMRLLVTSVTEGSAEGPPAPEVGELERLGEGTDQNGDLILERDGPEGRAVVAGLRAHGRTVGLLHLMDARAIVLDDARRRFLSALGYYAALAIERTRLVAEAERAEALREADRLKNIVLASVSHDLRTPLTTIKALAQAGALRGDANAGAIEEQADRLERLVGDLLDLSRLQSGALPVALELNAAEDLVGAALRQISGVSANRTIRTHLDLGEPALVGRFDFVQSLRILNNLLENALRYSPAAAPVDLAVRRDGSALAFEVADRGPGIPAGESERIFEPFYRAPGASPDGGRAGLGLAIARRLAGLQHGSLEYAPRPGGGSLFVLRLPAL